MCQKEAKTMKKRIFGWSVLMAACLVMSIGFSAWGADVIKIGIIGPMHFMQGKGH